MNLSSTNYKKVMTLELILRITYGLLFIIAGVDKFLEYIVVWSKYVSPVFVDFLPIHLGMFVLGVGIFEIILGILILWIAPRIGAYIAALWLFIIAINLITMGIYYDIAVRDIVMAIGAYVLADLNYLIKHLKHPSTSSG